MFNVCVRINSTVRYYSIWIFGNVFAHFEKYWAVLHIQIEGYIKIKANSKGRIFNGMLLERNGNMELRNRTFS